MGNTPPTKKKPQSDTNSMNLGRATQVAGNTPSKRQLSKRQKARQKQNARTLRLKRLSDRSWMPIDSNKRCAPALSAYGAKGRDKAAWMCDWNYQAQLKFQEKNYAAQLAEVRIFIEGAEVSAYLRGNITWSIQSTGGMNTCSFTLNNNQDAFIITPTNVCANIDPRGWRLPFTSKGKLITSAFRSSWSTDELAKYIIYKNKWDVVDPLGKNPKIDPLTGEWLYPLDPYRSIFHKHDCVRVFYRLPHISGMAKVVNKKVIDSRETWAPAFTGFIDEQDIEDDPVTGDRLMNIRCYDYRGLLDRMRVRTSAFRTVTSTKEDRIKKHQVFSNQNKKAKKGKKTGKAGINTDFLNKITKLGIAEQLIQLFKVAYESEVIATCMKSGGTATTACSKEVYSGVLELVKKDVADLGLLYHGGRTKDTKILGLEPARKAANNGDGRGREFERKNDGPVKMTTKKTGVEGIDKLIKKVRAFASKDGKAAVEYLVRYLGAYYAAAANPKSAVKAFFNTLYMLQKSSELLDKAVAQPLLGQNSAAQMIVLNTKTSEVQAVDAELQQKYPKVYADAGIGTTNGKQANRIYLLETYIRKSITDPFSSSSAKIKAGIDKEMMALAAKVPLFAGRRRPNPEGKIITAYQVSVITFDNQAALTTVVKALENYEHGSAVRGRLQEGTTGGATETEGLRDAARKLPALLEIFNDKLNSIIAKLKTAEKDAAAAIAKIPDVRARAKLAALRKRYAELHSKGQNNTVKKQEGAGPLADLVATDAKFSVQMFGMYGDLVKVSEKDPHPLSGMSFEMAALWLTLTHTPLSMGFEDKLSYYDDKVAPSKVRKTTDHLRSLEIHNMNMVFGIMGRPLTYAEVTEMGKGTISEVSKEKAPYSPLNAFVHMLLPKAGTGATSIVQQDITDPTIAKASYEFQTRLELLNHISELLDYQFYVTPIGDLSFEFPHYNALPSDFGKIFRGAYTVLKGLRSFKATTETGDINTAWVLTGKENEKIVDDITSNMIIKNKFKKNVIIADMLARRVGVKVRHLQLELPGVGAVFGAGASTAGTGTTLGVSTGGIGGTSNVKGQPLSTLIAYGLLEIQREFGRMETISVSHEFRPYMLPNRPIHIVHRQRMALIKSVNYSMAAPNGECTTQSELYYVRGLRRDGSFRHAVTGGKRMPVDYSGLFTGGGGGVRQKITFGSGRPGTSSTGQIRSAQSAGLLKEVLATTGQRGRNPGAFTNLSCGPYLKDRWMESAAAYSDQADSTFRKAANFQSQTSGAQGFAGEMAYPPPRGATSNIGARSFRKAPAKGERDAAVQLKGSGCSSATDQGKEKTDTKPYDYLQHFHNPWPFGILDQKVSGNIFSQWGFTRKITPAGVADENSDAIRTVADRRALRNARTHKGKVGGWHTGIDFSNLKKPTPAYAPIELHDVRAVLYTGWYSPAKGSADHRLVPAGSDGKPPADVLKFLMKVSKKGVSGRVLRTITKKIGEKPVPIGFGVVGVYQKYFYVNKRIEETYNRIITEANKGVSGRQKVHIPIKHSGAATGLFVYGYGMAVSPKAPDVKVACRLSYTHCHNLVKDSTGKYYLGSQNTPMQYRTAPADTVVTYAGNTGTSNIHLHFAMDVYPPGHEPKACRGGTSQDAYKAVKKANEEFLRTQLKMKLTAGKGRGLNDGKFSPAWQKFFKDTNKGGGNITTVDQATEYLIKKSGRFRAATALVGRGDNRIPTNPMFFFKPEQIIKTMDRKYAAHNKKYGNQFYAATSGASICGRSSAAAQQKISLEYSACTGKTRKKAKGKTRRAALKKCKDSRKKERQMLAGNVKLRQKDPSERAERVVAARVKAQNNTSRSTRRQEGLA